MTGVGIKLPNWGPLATTSGLAEVAVLAEERGFDSVWVSDHVIMPSDPAGDFPFTDDGRPPFEPRTAFQDPLVALAYVAARTTRVQLGVGVLVLPLRDPVMVAKQAATLDVLSGGRAVLGVGAGWFREEFELLGRSFGDRGRRTDAAMEALRACWSDDPFPLPGGTGGAGAAPPMAAMAPKPVRGRGLPLLVGGHSPAALARAARLGDGWYASGLVPEAFAPLACQVRERRIQEGGGRTPFAVGVKAPTVDPAETPVLEAAYRAAGADFVVFDVDFASAGIDAVCATVGRMADQLGLDDRRQ